jgi:type I restriction enzyme S subunit
MIAAEVKYKRTNFQWLPEIPDHWKLYKVKHLFSIGRGRVIAQTELIDDGLYPVYSSQTQDDGILGYINTFDFEGEMLTWTTDGVNAGSVFYRNGKFNTTNVCGVLKSKTQNDAKYLYYALAFVAPKCKRPDTNGAKIMNNEMAVISIPIPPIEEQKVIADYLDTQSTKINHFIQTKQRFIELLKEQRQSIITNAVTKGIDENVKMKETGIEWMPQIPFHWEIRRLKYLVELYKHNKSGAYPTNLDYKIALENIDNWTGKYVESVSPDFEGEGRYFKQGDVLFGKLRPYLAKAFLPDKDGICVSEILVFTPNSDLITNEFLFQRILTKGFIDIVDGSTYGAKMPRAGWDFIGNMRFVYPPTTEEQKRIVEHIKTETKTLDIAISKAEREIELIKEYREAMIAEAVTGKMKL